MLKYTHNGKVVMTENDNGEVMFHVQEETEKQDVKQHEDEEDIT
jgi:hypothetical protein